MNRDSTSTMKVKDLVVRSKHYDPHLDAYLIVGKRKREAKTLKNHVVAWVSRHNEQLSESKYFLDSRSATRYFNKTKNETHYPETPSLTKDWQKQRVYNWENKSLIPHALKINEKEAKSLIRKVSRDFSIRQPKLKMEKVTWNAEYDSSTNTIHFGSRDNITLLHELAHAIHIKETDDEPLADHSPGFVWTAIELYNKYAGINLSYLLLTAEKSGLLGDMKESQMTPVESHSFRRISQNAKRLIP